MLDVTPTVALLVAGLVIEYVASNRQAKGFACGYVCNLIMLFLSRFSCTT